MAKPVNIKNPHTYYYYESKCSVKLKNIVTLSTHPSSIHISHPIQSFVFNGTINNVSNEMK